MGINDKERKKADQEIVDWHRMASEANKQLPKEEMFMLGVSMTLNAIFDNITGYQSHQLLDALNQNDGQEHIPEFLFKEIADASRMALGRKNSTAYLKKVDGGLSQYRAVEYNDNV